MSNSGCARLNDVHDDQDGDADELMVKTICDNGEDEGAMMSRAMQIDAITASMVDATNLTHTMNVIMRMGNGIETDTDYVDADYERGMRNDEWQ